MVTKMVKRGRYHYYRRYNVIIVVLGLLQEVTRSSVVLVTVITSCRIPGLIGWWASGGGGGETARPDVGPFCPGHTFSPETDR